ncbi:MAG: PDZ domain-containing protein [Verrucomicrobiota bacterium]
MNSSYSSQCRRLIMLAGASLLLLASPGQASKHSPPSPAELRAFIEAADDKVRQALVRIRVVSTEFHGGREVKRQEVGSGVIITKDGYIITNHHVAGHTARIFCTLWDREEIEAELIGTDPLTDIAVIKLKPGDKRVFTPAVFGDSSLLQVGDPVLAMGSPMALSQSVTLGIISNTQMIMPRFWGEYGRFQLDGEDVGSLVRWIGHDAAIYGGNSGGPLCNLRGEIVGINEISFGLGGAIPGNLAKTVAFELIARGKITRSWLGIDPQPLFKEWKSARGVLIAGVQERSPAAKAGLLPGDILFSLAGKPLNVHFDEQMPDFMALATSLPIGKPAEALVSRGSNEVRASIIPIERGEMYPPEQEIKPWGLTARNFSFLLARELKRSNLNGVLVTSVRPGGPAGEAKPPLQNNDVLVAVNGTPIDSVQDLFELTRKISAQQSDPVPVLASFERRSAQYLTVVRVGIEEEKDPGLEVTKAWLPVETRVISREIAAQLGRPDLKGFYISRVYPGSTAEKAGLNPRDFIVAVDGEKLTASRPENEDELSSLIREYDVGKTVELSVLRDLKPLKIPVELERSPRLQREMKKYSNEDFEFTSRNVSFFDAAEDQWDRNQQGALIDEIKPGSWAELGGLEVGDLVVEVDSQSVGNVDALRSIMEKIAAQRKPALQMKVLRGVHHAYLEVEPDWNKSH